MKKFDIKKILVPTDFSVSAKIATDQAVDMARKSNSEVILLHVIEKQSFVSTVGDFILGRKSDSSKSEFAPERIKALADLLTKQLGLPISYEIVEGSIHAEIIKAAELHEVDLIMMGASSKKDGSTRNHLGNIASKVVNQCKIPVVTIQPNHVTAPFKTIVLPIDETLHSRERVNHAIELSEKYGSTVHLVGILNDNDEVSRKKLRLILAQVKDYLGKHAVPFESNSTFFNHAAKSTIEYAENVNADLILVMAENNVNILGGSIGDFSDYIVNNSAIPVMCVSAHVKANKIEFHPYGF